jgi:L-aspartate oxidase
MAALYDTRRYLTGFDVHRVPNLFVDVLVIGAGVAGLRAAIEAAKHGSVLLICKSRIIESNTWRAQGGVAAVLSENDTVDAHISDTLRVGCGLCDLPAVERLVSEGPDRIRELMDWGAIFDTRKQQIQLGLEAGHSAARIIHAQGDATGQEVANTLIRIVRGTRNIRVFEDCFAVDLITIDRQCRGVSTYHRHFGHQLFWAKQTILANGGCGSLYRETTNADISTGDGSAMAYRAGAQLRDMEMVQFHPTTLYVAGASRALISEAVRGEGAHLVDREGRRFMLDYHPDAELAPRDVVSRAIVTEMAKRDVTYMYLDVRHLNIEKFRKRFPGISRLCEQFEIDIAKDRIPVRPAAHYMIGGVFVDSEGRTTTANLWACGEVASTGVHGANRLASNSLLEGLVFGTTAGHGAGIAAASEPGEIKPETIRSDIEPSTRTVLDLEDVRNSLRSVMWRNVGISRIGQRLTETMEIVDFWGHYVMDKLFDEPRGWETQNMLTLARLIAASAQTREESRGVHFRKDHPETSPHLDGSHVVAACRGGRLDLHLSATQPLIQDR